VPTKEELVFLLSGGINNRDPDMSLGGDASHIPLFDGLNNLYDDITPEQALTANHVDYRCFYIKNFSDNTWENVRAYVSNYPDQSKEYVPPLEDGAFVQIGADNRDDLQQTTVIGETTGGSFDADFDGSIVTVTFDADIDVWATNYQTALRSLDDLSDVTVTGEEVINDGTFYVFRVTFTGNDGNRVQPFITIDANNLTGPGLINISVTKLLEGSPAGVVARQIAEETEVPPNVNFKFATLSNPVYLGNLHAGEGAGIWVKRFLLLPFTEVYMEDQFTIGVRGLSVIQCP
jgi:hypothetical protein